jgi:hypothetical protein
VIKDNHQLISAELVGKSSFPPDFKITSEEGSSEHFPPLTD